MTAVATQQQQKDEIVLKKREAYANLGEAIHRAEMELQVKAQSAIMLLAKLPSSIAEIAEAEKTLKEFKSQRVQIEKDRKAITSRFDPVLDRLMLIQKSTEEPEQKYTAAVLSLKKQHEAEEQKQLQIADARKRLVEKVEKDLAAANHASYEKINEQVQKAFETALEMDIQPVDIKDWIETSKAILGYKDFECAVPQVNTVLLKQEEANALIAEKWIYNAQGFVVVYHQKIDQKFSDYGIAYQNKAAALELARKQSQEEEARLNAEKADAEIAASLQASSTALAPDSVGMPVKEIKRSYAIDMLETPDNAIAIMAAFVANKQACLAKLRVSKWFSLTPLQMGNALAELKNADNNFQPSGINFKVVEKL